MTETNSTTDNQAEDVLENAEPTENEGQTDKTYTQSDVDELLKGYKSTDEVEEIVKARVAREKKAQEKAVAEAEKLAKMNAEEKQQYEADKRLEEFERLQRENEQLRREQSFYSMSKEAGAMLSEHGIAASEGILTMVVRDTADDTKTAVEAFVDVVNKTVDVQVKEKLKGDTPKVPPSSNPMDEFDKHLKKYE